MQLDPVITETLPLRPVDSAFTLSGFTLKLQLPNAWLTVTVWPATAIVPVRAADVEFTRRCSSPSRGRHAFRRRP